MYTVLEKKLDPNVTIVFVSGLLCMPYFRDQFACSKKERKNMQKRAYINLHPIRITSTKYKITRNRLKIIEKADAVVLEQLIVKLWILHITEQMRQFS